jgi:MFS family permease
MSLSSKPWYRWLLLTIFWIGFFFNAGAWLFPLSIKYDIVFGIEYLTEIQRSLLLTLPMVGLVLMAFFSGIIIDKIGVRKTTLIAFTITTVFGFLRGLSPNFLALSLFLIIFGMGIGIVLALPSRLVADWFEPRQYGLTHGVITMASGLGIFFFEFINKPLIHDPLYGLMGDLAWRVNFFIFAGFSLCSLIVWIILARDKPKAAGSGVSRPSLREGLAIIVRQRYIWLLAIVNIAVLTAYFGGKHFITEMLGLQPISHGTIFIIISIMSLGAMFGNVIIPKLSDHLGKRKIFLIEAMLCLGIFLIVCGLLVELIALEVVALLILGFSVGSVIPLIPSMVTERIDSKYVATAVGLVICLGNLFSLLIPNLLQVVAHDQLSYLISLIVIALICFVGFVTSLSIREVHPLQTE